MTRLFLLVLAMLVAAGIAYVWVMPGALDELGLEGALQQLGVDNGAGPVPAAQPAKDNSRVSSSSAENGATAGGAAPVIGSLDLAALPFDVGCGLYLSREGEDDVVFADATTQDGGGAMAAAMVLDGALVSLQRTTADGEPLVFDQYPRQIFDSADGSVRVVVEVDLGESSDPNDVPVTAGEVIVMKAGRPTLSFRVSGGAGC